MPDITYRFIGEDQLTPMINQLKAALASLAGQQGKAVPTGPAAGAGPANLSTQMQQAQTSAGGLVNAVNNAKAATAALGQEAKAFTTQLELGKKIFDALQKQIPGLTVERAKGMMGGSPQDIAEQSAALDAYVAHQKKAQQEVANAIELAEAKQQFRREEMLDRNAQIQIQHLERQARKEAPRYEPLVTQIPTPRASAFGQMGEDMAKAKDAGEGLSGTLGTLGRHLARMPVYVIGFKLLEVAMGAIGHVASVLIPNIQDYNHWINIAAASNENGVGSFRDLAQAAALTNTALGETQKRAMAFVMAGSSMEQAAKQAGMVQEEMQRTGVDLTDVFAKAQVRGATLQDALKAGVGHPEIQERALQDELWQNQLKHVENDMEKRQHAAQHVYEIEQRGIQRAREDREESANYEIEDRHRAESYAMEDSHRNIRRQQEAKRTAIEDNLEDTQHAEDRAQEMRHTGMEREMEDRHTLLEREMEDRHKAESRAQQDAQREHQERLAIAQSVGGAEQAIAEGRGTVMGQIGKKRVSVPIPASIQATIKAEQEEGYAELEREGVSRSEAQYMIRAHVMSPGALTQAAERARERKNEEADRKRDDEAQQQERQFQDESRQQGRTIHDEGIALSEAHYEERTQASRDLRDEEREAGHQMENDQTGQARRQTQESQEQGRTFRAWDKENERVDQDRQSAMGEQNYQEQQGLKDEGLRQDKQRQDDLNDLQHDQLNDYNKRVKETVGGLENMAPAIGGQALIRAPYVHERSMFAGGQALKTKDDAVLRKVQELINIFMK